MTSTCRKSQCAPDPLAAIRYTPAALDEDPDDVCGSGVGGDHNRLSFITISSGAPLNGDVAHSTVITPTTTPSMTGTSPYPYYDFQESDDNDSEAAGGGGGCDVSEPCSPATLQHCSNLERRSSSSAGDGSCGKRPNNHSSAGSRHSGHAQHYGERSDSRDLNKSPVSRTSRGRHGGKGRCMCCMMCVFLLSTAGLAAVLALTYAGEMQLAPTSTHHTANNGGVKTDRLEDEKVVVQNCETRECMAAAAAILGRMNLSANPCSNFYSYACGAYNERTYLSWFSTRIRESPEEIIEHYRKYAIDRLSSSYGMQDSTYLSKARTLFRSCLFRPTAVDERTRTIVAEVIDALGGLTVPERDGVSNFDITPLVANVTRLYGASPFFRVVVHGPNKISIVSRFSEYRNPLQSPSTVLSRSMDSQPGQEAKSSRHSLEQLLLSLLSRTNYTGLSVPAVVQDFLRLESNIKRILKSDERSADEGDEDLACDDADRRSFSELQFRYGGYGINWTELVRQVLDVPSTRSIIICRVRLSGPLQHLLEITPKKSLWQFTILHTLVHSDLFLLLSGHGAQLMTSPSTASGSALHAPGSALGGPDAVDGRASPQSPEEQCLDLVEYVMPAVKNRLHCDKDALKRSVDQVDDMMEHLRLAMFLILKGLFSISPDSAWRITNSTVNDVKMRVMLFLLNLGKDQEAVRLDLDEDDFSANVHELVKFRNQQYLAGMMDVRGLQVDMTALGIRACFKDSHLARPGPHLYHSAVSHAVRFGSLGTFLAAKVADKLGFVDLLDHYAGGVLNHSAVLGLAVRLQCFVQKYSKIVLLDYGTTVYRVDGEQSKVQIWKDQFTLQLVMMAWRRYHDSMTSDKTLPGLHLSRDQLFYVSYAQTQCERVSERGILQHYVINHDNPTLPSVHRVNEPLKNHHDFHRAFNCGRAKDSCDLF